MGTMHLSAQADWSMEHAAWVPGIPVSCESEMTCLQETFVPSSSGGQQLVQYAAAATPDSDNPIDVFQRIMSELHLDIDLWEKKIHRYPPSIRDVGEQYTVPKIVSIGPYHHGRERLKKAEQAKHAAAYSCIVASGLPVQELYAAVVSAAVKARSLYDKDTMAGIEDDDFLPMMFYDACFLVQWMYFHMKKTVEMVPWLFNFLNRNRKNIKQDVLQLENQLPWVVVETLMRYTPVCLEDLVARLRRDLQARRDHDKKPVVLDHSYEPAHLLGLLRFYMVGKSEERAGSDRAKPPKKKSVSVSAIELAEIGITLRPSDKIELVHMGIQKVGLFTELHLVPLSLTYKRASLLVNMAAFELTSDHVDVCSYLGLLAMLVHREEDVQELRSRNLLQGGGGLTNNEALLFFTSLQGLPYGDGYKRTIREIETYKQNRRIYVKVHAFCYRNAKTMLLLLSVIATISSIMGSLFQPSARNSYHLAVRNSFLI